MILVDRDEGRASEVAARFGVGRTASDLGAVLDEIDGAVLAVPHHLHVPLSLQCVRAGVHVLCEKPLAETSAEVEEIVAEAEKHGVTVTVNNKRRLQSSMRTVKKLLDEGRIGTVTGLEFLQGEKFDWPAATNGYFGSAGGGKGVLFDIGAHVLDLVCWWLEGKPNIVSYEDDSRGGTEAVARVLFELGECKGVVQLSWLTKYENTYRITGDWGAIEGHVYDDRTVTLVGPNGAKSVLKDPHPSGDPEIAKVLLGSFIDICGGAGEVLVGASDIAPSIAWIEECYAARQPFSMPWYANASQAASK
jgi:predicted dehydrogenase